MYEKYQKKLESLLDTKLEKTKKVELGAIDDLKKKLVKQTSVFDKHVSKVRDMARIFVDQEDEFKKLMNEASLIKKQLSDLGIDDPKDLGFISLRAKEMANLSREFIKSLR